MEEQSKTTHDEIMAEIRALRQEHADFKKQLAPIVKAFEGAKAIRWFIISIVSFAAGAALAVDWVVERWSKWFP